MRILKKTLSPVLLGLLALSGCKLAQVDQTVVSQTGAAGDDAQMEFWHRLNDAKVASNDDAFHAIVLYLDGNDEYKDYADRVAGLKSRGLLPADFNAPEKESVQRGIVAVALANALKIKGGLAMRVVGTTPRYATRELAYEGIYPPSSPNQTFSGSELVGIMGRVEDYQRGDPANKRAADLPGDAAEAK